MRIFVAGATGALGRRIVPTLVAAGHEVTAVGRTPEKRAMLTRFGATPVDVSLFDRAALRPAVAGHAAVINVATRIPPSSEAFFPWAWRENSRIRSLASHSLVDAAINGGATRFVQEAFAPIYEDRGDAWIDESAPVRPVSYNRAVLDAEEAAQGFSRDGRAGVVLRFAYFYGADSAYTRDMVRFARWGIAASPGSPDAYHSSVSHDDAAAAVIAALDLPAGTYNVSDDEPLRRGEFFAALAGAFSMRTPRFLPRWVTRMLGATGELLGRSQRISSRKLRQASSWRPTLPSAREGWRMVAAELLERG